MWIFAYIAFFMAAIFNYVSSAGDSGAAEIRVSSSEEIKQYKAFITAADHYYSNPERVALKKSYWNDIKDSAPIGIQMADMRSSWYAIKSENGEWTACTDMSEEAMANIAQLFPAPDSGQKIQKIDRFFAVGDAEVASAATMLCQL
ncbi:hypothetical protein ABEW79_11250 [Delftia tsuruhatensis]|uniref:hypothetical protein n=1 Tax=Delftia tsuruhatensis TaxID=180282 RepID=UPI003D1A8380